MLYFLFKILKNSCLFIFIKNQHLFLFPKSMLIPYFVFSYYFTGLLSHSLPLSRSGRNCFPVFGATKVITLLFLPKLFSTFLNLFFGASQTSK